MSVSSASVRKESLDIQDGPGELQDASRRAGPRTRNPACNSSSCDDRDSAGTDFPSDAPHRSLYVAARTTGASLAVALIVLSVVTLEVADLPAKWMSTILSPSINSLVLHVVDLWCVLGFNKRSSPVLRLWWDGALVFGLAIAGAFLAWFTSDEINGGHDRAAAHPVDALTIGPIILVAIFLDAIIHLNISFRGWRQLRDLRAAKATTASTAV